MSLTLKVISPAILPDGQLPTFTFDEFGGSIGRKPNNDFVLIDPERFISSQHANIEHHNGSYFIVDASTNGVFINNEKRPVGTGNSQALSNGDRISIGEFQLEIIIDDASNDSQNNVADVMGNNPPPISNDTFNFDEPLVHDNTSGAINDMDPLALLGGSGSGFGDSGFGNSGFGDSGFDNNAASDSSDILSGFQAQETPFASSLSNSGGNSNSANILSNDFFDDSANSQSQNIPDPLPIHEPFTPPSAIPDDWDIMGEDLLGHSPATNENALLQPDTQTGSPSAPELKPKPASAEQIPDSFFSEAGLFETNSNAEPASGFPETQLDNTAALIPEDDFFNDLGLGGENHTNSLASPHAEPNVNSVVEPHVKSTQREEDDIFASLTSNAQPMQNPSPDTEHERRTAQPPVPEATPFARPNPIPNTAPPVATPQQTATPQQVATPQHFSQPPQPAYGTTNNQPPPANQSRELIDAFIKGAGLDPSQINADNPVELLTKLGQLTRISTEGLMMALRARSTIKSSFRVNKTIIAPVENNPLKFSVTSEDALKIIFADERTGYMSATEAFSQGFKDLQTHQMAMMAGMQGVIQEITLQFSPQTLERKFEPQQSGGFMSGNKKAKNWELYEMFYKKMTDTLQDDFQNIYGEEFARAYENQVRKLM